MTYFAITEQTATWTLSKVGVLDQIHALLADGSGLLKLRDQEFVQGPVRVSASDDGSAVAYWNVDYTSGSGDDKWGFVDINSLQQQPSISREVLERCLYVISQRLQGLLIEGAFIHRSLPNGVHTCLSGRGKDARQMSIAYVEKEGKVGAVRLHSMIVTGPSGDLTILRQTAVKSAEQVNALLAAVRRLYDPARTKATLSNTEFPELRDKLDSFFNVARSRTEFAEVNVPTASDISTRDAILTSGWSYSQWMEAGSPLSQIQRGLLTSNAIYAHPIRIIGPGGSGKTLLMQLLTLRCLKDGVKAGRRPRLLYLVHNAKMAEMVSSKFGILIGEDSDFESFAEAVDVRTLSEYGRHELGLDENQVIDPDAYEAKQFQLEVLKEALDGVLATMPEKAGESKLFQYYQDNALIRDALVRLLMSEVSSAIKGHGLGTDQNRYVQSERPLSRLHGVLKESEREIVFNAFGRYHRQMFEVYGVLDSDDVAISLLGRLKTPIWELKRRQLGYDHVFIDETQLFNENERRLLPLLAKVTVPYLPIVFALDEAQDLYGQVSAGLASLGIENVFNETLSSIHRSSQAIVRLAFFVIQKSTDLFGPDFPDFTKNIEARSDSTSRFPKPTRVEVQPAEQGDFGRFVLKRVRALRKENCQRIAVICLAEQYWNPVLNELRSANLPLHVLEQRGEKLGTTDGIVVLSRPAHIGGQEFDAVIITGAEQGLAPPRVVENHALASAVEQQTLRELYLAITRARHQVVFALAQRATLCPILQDAGASGLLSNVD